MAYLCEHVTHFPAHCDMSITQAEHKCPVPTGRLPPRSGPTSEKKLLASTRGSSGARTQVHNIVGIHVHKALAPGLSHYMYILLVRRLTSHTTREDLGRNSA